MFLIKLFLAYKKSSFSFEVHSQEKKKSSLTKITFFHLIYIILSIYIFLLKIKMIAKFYVCVEDEDINDRNSFDPKFVEWYQ